MEKVREGVEGLGFGGGEGLIGAAVMEFMKVRGWMGLDGRRCRALTANSTKPSKAVTSNAIGRYWASIE